MTVSNTRGVYTAVKYNKYIMEHTGRYIVHRYMYIYEEM